jgi:hypothetical protein
LALLYREGDRLFADELFADLSPRSAGAACPHGSWQR